MVGEQPGVVTTSMRRVGCQEPTVTPHSKPAQLQKDWVATPSGIGAAEELMPAMRMGKRQLKQKVSTMLAERIPASGQTPSKARPVEGCKNSMTITIKAVPWCPPTGII